MAQCACGTSSLPTRKSCAETREASSCSRRGPAPGRPNSIRLLWTADDVEVRLLNLLLLHDARRRGEGTLAGLMSCSLGLRRDRLAVDHAVGGGEADLDVLGVCRHDTESNHEAKLHDQDEASRPHGSPSVAGAKSTGSKPYILALRQAT